MRIFRKTLLPLFSATVWICLSEFFRNEYLLKSYWTDHYNRMGLVFPSRPVNGAVWLLWSFLFAISIYIISKKFNFVQTFLLSWFTGFVLMWVVTRNLGVLPYGILYAALPLSLLEVFVASYLIKKFHSDDYLL